MLIRFSAQNAYCFLGETVLSMIATSDARHQNHVNKIARKGAPTTLRAAGIYGANGHGKTKLVDAMKLLKRVASGLTENASDIPSITYRLNKTASQEPTKLVINFRVKETDYEYGLVLSANRIEQEWLFESTSTREVLLFSRERRNDSKKIEYNYEFGARLNKSKSPSKRFDTSSYLDFIATGTKPYKSFLSEAVERKIERLQPCFEWFVSTLSIISPESMYSDLHEHAAADDSFLKFLSKALCRTDTGIVDLKLNKIDSLSEFVKKLPNTRARELTDRVKEISDDEALLVDTGNGSRVVVQKENDGYSVLELVALHKTSDGSIEFDMKDESSGTQRLLDLYPILFSLTESDKVYIVDELDRKLHPLLAYDFVETFLAGSKGQLVYTTHTTHMLDLDLLRRDEIWLVQKKQDGSSELYSLNEFKVRPDLDVRKGYLQGRFGGIPFVGDATALGWC